MMYISEQNDDSKKSTLYNLPLLDTIGDKPSEITLPNVHSQLYTPPSNIIYMGDESSRAIVFTLSS